MRRTSPATPCCRENRASSSISMWRRAMAEPVGVLGEIAATKRQELASHFDGVSLEALREQARSTTRSLVEAIARPGSSFILEIKKASPSGGTIRSGADAGAI